jgi:phospholipase C
VLVTDDYRPTARAVPFKARQLRRPFGSRLRPHALDLGVPERLARGRKVQRKPEAMSKIEHVVVLMLENRSFDNVLGRLYPKSEQFDGLAMDEWNPWHKEDGSVERVGVWSSDTTDPPTLPKEDPGELFSDMEVQIYGLNRAVQPTMNGFVDNYMRQSEPHGRPDPRSVMHIYRPEQLPATTLLARSFGVCDRWFASAPCETWPNRYFLHCGTAGGYVNNERSRFPYRWPRLMPTIFRRLDRHGHPWKVYFHDLPQAATLVELWPKIPTHFRFFDPDFAVDAASGCLPSYSFIEPRYYSSIRRGALPNDQHPPHDLQDGEALVAAVYNTLRSAPTWSRTLLLILYDEHGGCYDHVPPPEAVSPGGRYPDGFRFDRFGVRIPAVIVSPLIPAGTVVRPIGRYPFDHCSVQATLHQLFDLGKPLSPRVAAAPDVLSALTLSAPENAGPERIPVSPPSRGAAELRAYRRRPHNHHQSTLLSAGHIGPAALAHVAALVRSGGRRKRLDRDHRGE